MVTAASSHRQSNLTLYLSVSLYQFHIIHISTLFNTGKFPTSEEQEHEQIPQTSEEQERQEGFARAGPPEKKKLEAHSGRLVNTHQREFLIVSHGS